MSSIHTFNLEAIEPQAVRNGGTRTMAWRCIPYAYTVEVQENHTGTRYMPYQSIKKISSLWLEAK